MKKVTKCKKCGTDANANEKFCSKCGSKLPKSHWIIWVIIAFLIIMVVKGCSTSGTSSTSSTTESATATNNSTQVAKEESVKNIPTEYKNALKKAQIYSKTMHMSKQSIYDQLTSEYGEKFSAEAAQYAVDNLQADYNANALAKAKQYQESMSMSKSSIYDQLISEYGEKFTPEEAQYAIDNLGD